MKKLLVFIAVVMGSNIVFAANVVWNSPDGSWSIATNWGGNVLPGSSDSAYINKWGTTIDSDVGSITALYAGYTSLTGEVDIVSGGHLLVTSEAGRIGRSGYVNSGGGINMTGGTLQYGASQEARLILGLDSSVANAEQGSMTISGGIFAGKLLLGGNVVGGSEDLFRVEGGAATIGSTHVGSGYGLEVRYTGAMEFAFDDTGISEMIFADDASFHSNSEILVDGLSYRGGANTFTLINASSFVGTPQITLTNFYGGASYGWDTTNGNFTVSAGAGNIQGNRVWRNVVGSWTDAGNWMDALPPRSVDAVFINIGIATIDSDVGSVTALQMGYTGVTGYLDIVDGANLTVTTSNGRIGRSGYVNAAGEINMTGGTLTYGASQDKRLIIGLDSNDTILEQGIMTISGGTFAGGILLGANVAGGSRDLFRVEGNAATIGSTNAVEGFGLEVRSTGDLEFIFDETGVSALSYANEQARFYSGSTILVDGSLYFGPTKTVTLISATSFYDATAPTITLTNFYAGASYEWDAANGAFTVTTSNSIYRTVYVATNGNDSWSGRFPVPTDGDGPLATLIGARDRIRAIRGENDRSGFEVLVRGGTYYESPTLRLYEQDSGMNGSPVVYKAYLNEVPVLSGGRKFPQVVSQGNGTYAALIPEAANRSWKFRQLFVDDERYTLARSPNSGYYTVAGIPPEAASPYHGEPYWDSHNFIFNDGDLFDWSGLASNDVNLRVYSYWEAQTVYLTSVDEANHTAFSETHVNWGYTPSDTVSPGGISKRYIVENAPDSLDAPGEWQLNRETGVLTVIPFDAEDLSSATLIAPVVEKAIVFSGDADETNFVEQVHFEGLAFRHYATPVLAGDISGGWRANQAASTILGCINLNGTKDIVFAECEVSHIGYHAFNFERGCVSNRIEQCHIYDLGGGGIYMGEKVRVNQGYDPSAFGRTGDNVIYNNYIHDGGIIHVAAMGILLAETDSNLVSQNEIGYFNQSGMQIGWNWDASTTYHHNNRIENNYIHDIGQNTSSDLAGIYTVGENLNTVVRGNVIRDIYCYTEGSGKGLYPDENTDGVTFSDNLVYNVGSYAFGVNYCRNIVVSNNIFALSYGKAPFMFGHGAVASVTRNIFYYPYGNVYGDNSDKIKTSWFAPCDSNLFWCLSGPVQFQASAPADDAVTNVLSFAEWKSQTGIDAHSVVADPMFSDPLGGDFSFADTSAAESIGFVPVDWSQAGLVGSVEWTSLPENYTRSTEYTSYLEERPGDTFVMRGLDAVADVEFSMVSDGIGMYGAIRVDRFNIPADVPYDVWVTDDLLSTNWTKLAVEPEVVADGIIQSVTVRDTEEIRTVINSRFYRLKERDE